ncbi:protein IMPACT-like [Actinia tenebrosa]|uniref:Protein IMPACT-like n=1 Tax=Actinia tenebrosa TaxID=6105 RepID=A0A6P8HS45_ACTTE|nr:protein IMPACT-like [Actinia tenebrosa]
MRIEEKASKFEIFDGEIIKDGENRVQAHLAVITSKDQVEEVLAELKKKDPDVPKATHNIWAYRIFDAKRDAYDEKCDDDGDDTSGAKLLRFLQRTRATDVMVVVSCWYETTAEELREVRFKCIQKSVRDLFVTHSGKVSILPRKIKWKFYEEAPKFEILHGETIEDRKSTFQAHICDITSRKQVDQVLNELKKDRKIANAKYNMWACRIYDEKKKSYIEEGYDDGENLGGERLLHLLQKSDAKNVVIIVTCWHDGKLGKDRFKHINKCASDLLEQRKISKN